MINFVTKKIGKTQYHYLNFPFTFDTETSKCGEIAWIYSWAFKTETDKVYTGRTPTDFIQLLDKLRVIYNLDTDYKRMVIYVHNLSYDLTYMYRFLERYAGGKLECLWLDTHKCLQCICGNFVFRCSYLLSNMSLDRWGKALNVSRKKLTGAIDYDIVRYQDEPLTDIVWKYQIMDVVSQQSCILEEMRQNNDTIVSIPLTSTGYVRRDCRNSVKGDKKYRDWFLKTRLDKDSYTACRKAFAGGYVHANRFLTNKVVSGNIGHFDFKSFYPSTQMLCYFPVTKFTLFYDSEKDGIIDSAIIKQQLNTKCCLMEIAIENIKLKNGVTAPYLQKAKMYGNMSGCHCDNGRVLTCKGRNVMFITELDYDIIKRQYDADIEVLRIWTSERGEFPEQFKNVIMKYFEVKENLTEGYYYMKSKNKLNAIYGMSVTDVLRNEVEYEPEKGGFDVKRTFTDDEVEELLNKFYKSRNNFFPYQLGVWVTAHCRHDLINLIEEIGYDRFLYCDTDSIFFLTDEHATKIINDYNKNVVDLCKQKGYYVNNKKGGISFFRTFEDENEGITDFKSLHSKCYAFICKDGLNSTIAGVSEHGRNGVNRSQELGCIHDLRYGKKFVDCGSTKSAYIYHDIAKAEVNGHVVEFSDACIISENVKTIKGDTIFDSENFEIYDY